MNEKHIGSDFNEFYIEALEETIRDLTGNGDKGEERPLNVVERQVARRMYKEYKQWLSEWNGDYPDEREHATFSDWLEGRE